MSKVTTFLNRIFMMVVVVLSLPRLAVTRIFPSYQQTQRPPTAKVFALSDAAWTKLRAGGDFVNQDKGASKSTESQQEPSKDESNKSANDKKEPSKNAECDKAGPKSGDDSKRTSPSGDKKSDDKTKDASKTTECDTGAGGGDGDVGGTGG